MKALDPTLRILGETPDFLAVEKPAGLLVHPTKPGGPVTLWDRLRELLACELAGGGAVSIINRLDRETSGVVLVAKHSDAARRCGIAMTQRRFVKRYVAWCAGWPKWETRTVDAPLLRLGEIGPSRIWLKRGVHPAGRAAVTEFRVLERRSSARLGRFAVLEAVPQTGRTHQIRVHLAHAGNPVLGDKIYGPDEGLYLRFIETGWTDELAERLVLPRHALHSRLIGFEDGGVCWRWESPPPADIDGWGAGG